jgi:hypothetical protein
MTTERTSLKARIPSSILTGLTTFRGVAAIVITAAALFSTVGAAQLSDADELDAALPCHHLAGVLPVDDCAHFNTLARQYASGAESALNCVGYVDNVQGEIQASAAYLTGVKFHDSADSISELSEQMQMRLRMNLEMKEGMMAAFSNLAKKISETQDQMVGRLK